MHLPTQLATHLRHVYFGGNWTGVNWQDALEGVTYVEASTRIGDLNTILVLVTHVGYYTRETLPVYEGSPLSCKDDLSFTPPDIQTEKEWSTFVKTFFADAERLIAKIEQVAAETIWQPFSDEKYGTYYRNIQGLIEHAHYHLGQVVVLRRLLRNGLATSS